MFFEFLMHISQIVLNFDRLIGKLIISYQSILYSSEHQTVYFCYIFHVSVSILLFKCLNSLKLLFFLQCLKPPDDVISSGLDDVTVLF